MISILDEIFSWCQTWSSIPLSASAHWLRARASLSARPTPGGSQGGSGWVRTPSYWLTFCTASSPAGVFRGYWKSVWAQVFKYSLRLNTPIGLWGLTSTSGRSLSPGSTRRLTALAMWSSAHRTYLKRCKGSLISSSRIPGGATSNRAVWKKSLVFWMVLMPICQKMACCLCS